MSDPIFSDDPVFLTCPEHASKPDPALHSLPLPSYVGRYVKIAFSEPAPSKCKEHMWVQVQKVTHDHLTGVLDNDPRLNVGVKFGDEITFPVDRIEAML
jgi:hypothetical protein